MNERAIDRHSKYQRYSRRRALAIALVAIVSGGAAAYAQDATAQDDVAQDDVVDFTTPSADAEKTASGIYVQVLTPGTGKRHPATEDMVAVHFIGWSPQGTKLYSSYDLGKPVIAGMWMVFPGWQETLFQMVSDEKRRIWLPDNLVARDRGPKGASIFDLELVGIKILPKPPENLGTPPANAQKTPSGAFTEPVKAGTGEQHPAADSTVLMHYIGWTTDGKIFDSSHDRGRPTAFPLAQVMPAFAETVQLMVAGERRRVWIPGPVARGNWVGSPRGMLVFEISLLRILPDDALKLQPAAPPGQSSKPDSR